MATLTIPSEFAERKDLVAVPRKTFEEFMAWQKLRKSGKVFSAAASEKKALLKARKNRGQGKYLTVHELRRSLDRSR
jgi:hypothetical protein